MGSGLRVLATFIALCLGFALVMGTVGATCYIIMDVFRIPWHRDPAIPLTVFVGVLVLFGLIIAIGSRAVSRAVPKASRRVTEHTEANESRMLQELYQGFSQLEDRVEALETILLDRAGPVSVRKRNVGANR
ncbi:MAG TPA: envelope stress response membrane protein PspB [Candidatus Hydrogenedentes bacterium]|nr:envelope stress response membrane protein PspB [Candidatus Hydrogenedentota bacterium]